MHKKEDLKYNEDIYKKEQSLDNNIFDAAKIYSKVHCPSCNSEVHSDNLNIDDKIAKCSSCHVVFPIGQLINQLSLKESSSGQLINKPIEVDKIELDGSTELMTKAYVGAMTYLSLTLVILFTIITILGSFKSGFNASLFSLSLLPLTLMIYFMYRQRQHYVHIVMDDNSISYFKDPKGLSKDKSFQIDHIKKVVSVFDQIWGGFKVSMTLDDGQGEREVKLMRSSKKVTDYVAQEVRKFVKQKG